MKNPSIKIFLAMIALFLMLGMVPASSQQAAASVDHPMEQAVLLMFSSHMRLNGEAESAQLTGTHLAALSQQNYNGNEMDALIQLYADMIAKIRASNDYDPDMEARLIAQLEARIKELHAKAEALAAKRNQPRRRGGLNRMFHWLGQKAGRVVGGAMDAAGKIVEFGIEEVAPKVLKDALYGGSPLNAALVRKVTRKLLLDRVVDAVVRDQRRKVEGPSTDEALAKIPTLHPDVQATRDADPFDDSALDENLLDQEEIAATRVALNATAEAVSGGSSSAGSEIIAYDFTASDAYNFNSDWGVGSFQWQTYWQSVAGDGYCFMEPIYVDSGNVHLEFNQQEMTVSGYIEANAQKSSDGGGMPYNISGSYRVEFTNLQAYHDASDPANGIAVRFKGEGSGAGSISGTATCKHYSEASKGDVYNSSSGKSINNLSIPVNIILLLPDQYSPGGNLRTLEIFGGPLEEQGFKYTFSFSFSQPIEIVVP